MCTWREERIASATASRNGRGGREGRDATREAAAAQQHHRWTPLNVLLSRTPADWDCDASPGSTMGFVVYYSSFDDPRWVKMHGGGFYRRYSDTFVFCMCCYFCDGLSFSVHGAVTNLTINACLLKGLMRTHSTYNIRNASIQRRLETGWYRLWKTYSTVIKLISSMPIR